MVRVSLLLLGLLGALGTAPAAAQEAEPLPEIVAALLEEADRHRRAGRSAAAVEGYREVIRRHPAAVDAYRGLGALLHREGALEQALAAFEDGLAEARDDPGLRYNAAVVALALCTLAAYLPARVAARVEPVRAIRYAA